MLRETCAFELFFCTNFQLVILFRSFEQGSASPVLNFTFEENVIGVFCYIVSLHVFLSFFSLCSMGNYELIANFVFNSSLDLVEVVVTWSFFFCTIASELVVRLFCHAFRCAV